MCRALASRMTPRSVRTSAMSALTSARGSEDMEGKPASLPACRASVAPPELLVPIAFTGGTYGDEIWSAARTRSCNGLRWSRRHSSVARRAFRRRTISSLSGADVLRSRSNCRVAACSASSAAKMRLLSVLGCDSSKFRKSWHCPHGIVSTAFTSDDMGGDAPVNDGFPAVAAAPPAVVGGGTSIRPTALKTAPTPLAALVSNTNGRTASK